MLTEVHKYVETTLTKIEIMMLHEAFDMFESKYKNEEKYEYYIKKYGKKGHNIYIKEKYLPKPSNFEGLKKYFESLHDVVYNIRYIENKETKMRFGFKDPIIIIDVLENYLKKKKFDDHFDNDNDRMRENDFFIHILKKDTTELIKGMKDIQTALFSSWVDKVEYIP